MASIQPFHSFHPSRPQSDTPYASSDLSLPTPAPFSDLSRQELNNPTAPALFSISRPRSHSTNVSTSSFVKRKPLPSSASSLLTRSSVSSQTEPLPEPTFHRPYELDSPTLYENPLTPRASTKETSGSSNPDEGKQRNFR